MSVTIKNSKLGTQVTAYTENPESGYVILESNEFTTNGSSVYKQKRTTLLSAKVDTLQDYLAAFAKNGQLPGRINVIVCTEDNIPAMCAKKLSTKVPFEEAIVKFIKVPGTGGPAMTVNGERILRFAFHDVTGNVQDVILAHDNVEEVQAWSAAQKVAKVADLPA